MEALAVIELVALVVEKGAPAVKSACEAFDKEVVTVEDVRSLRDKVKAPASYRKSD